MTKDEALQMCLEYIETDAHERRHVRWAIKKALAQPEEKYTYGTPLLDAFTKDYEPADGTQVSKVWWDGEKLMAKPIPLEDIYQPAPECVWEHEDSDYMPDTWKSNCGVLWTFTDGSPVENDMKYCCGCGAKLKENT